MLFLYLKSLDGVKIMPRPIKDNKNFEISRSIVYNGKDNNFHMASMSACIDHFEIGFLISGSHHVYSTDGECIG